MALKNYFTFASALSVARVFFLIPIFIFYENTLAVIALILLAAITDTLDGSIARWTKTASEEGAFVDGICDKLFFIPLFIFIVVKESYSSFALVAFLLRDVGVILLTIIAGILSWKKHGFGKFRHEIKSRLFGKVTTVLLFISLFWVLINLPYLFILLWAVLLSSIASIIDYMGFFIRRYRMY